MLTAAHNSCVVSRQQGETSCTSHTQNWASRQVTDASPSLGSGRARQAQVGPGRRSQAQAGPASLTYHPTSRGVPARFYPQKLSPRQVFIHLARSQEGVGRRICSGYVVFYRHTTSTKWFWEASGLRCISMAPKIPRKLLAAHYYQLLSCRAERALKLLGSPRLSVTPTVKTSAQFRKSPAAKQPHQAGQRIKLNVFIGLDPQLTVSIPCVVPLSWAAAAAWCDSPTRASRKSTASPAENPWNIDGQTCYGNLHLYLFSSGFLK